MSDIFQEVDEEVRADRIKEMWKTYRFYIIGGAIAIVLGVTSNVFWKEYVSGVQQAESEQFDTAVSLIQDGDTGKAITLLEKMVSETDSGYATIAEFKIAAGLVSLGDVEGAVDVYEGLADSTLR